MTERLKIEQLIRETDALTYLNALKSALSELKEELSTLEETREYQNQAIERARKLIRRIDNQYRAIVKASQGKETEVHSKLNWDEIDIDIAPEEL